MDPIPTPAASPRAAPRWHLVLNGKAAGDEDVRAAVQALRDAGVDLGVRVTWESGDAERYVDEALHDGVDVVVAGGGDGTLSAIAAALARHERPAEALPALALLPLGTANDFATAAGLPDTPEAALRLVLDTRAQAMDLLRIESDEAVHWCANLASGGFGTQVTVETDEGLKKVLGGLAYLVTGIARLGRIEPVAARIEGPGFQWQGEFIALGLGNGRQAGGGQQLCPEAVVDDGRLDLTLIPPLDGEVGETVATLLTEGREGALDRIALRERLPWVHLESDSRLVLNLDGEPVESRRFRVDCVGGRLRMHLPPGCPLLGVPGNPGAATDPGPGAPMAGGLLPA
ncbi:lipid kinase YegS [Marilutibacter aestuarii]|uniref:Probable lipid kinase YegS-like n=1 Tax=Marilutibacter aestuarii TaxID=1706195 RepID=A0A508A125_9GAMM|nr:lipid kinase YegS [Lysobacter aestuarii]TQD39532.1 lipid kinase YegS [Lysobacter aestuarii]